MAGNQHHLIHTQAHRLPEQCMSTSLKPSNPEAFMLTSISVNLWPCLFHGVLVLWKSCSHRQEKEALLIPLIWACFKAV